MTNTIFGPPPAPGSIFPVDFFRVYIEITLLRGNLWQGSISPSVDKTNFKPQFKPNTISNFRIQHDVEPAFGMFSAWAANFGPPAYLGANIEMKVTIDQNNLDTCGVSQIRGNATKQNYMSCLEDKTRKINFTKNTVKQKTIISVAQAIIEILPSTTVIPITSGPYTIIKFTNTSPGQTLNINFKKTGWLQLEHFAVGGGGGGGPVSCCPGSSSLTYYLSGGGGGGCPKQGLDSVYGIIGQTITIPITVGSGGPDASGANAIPNGTGYDGSGSTIGYPSGIVTATAGTGGWIEQTLGIATANGGDSPCLGGWLRFGGIGLFMTATPPPPPPPSPPAPGYGAAGGGAGRTSDGGDGNVNGFGGNGGGAYIFSEDHWGVSNPSLYGAGGGGGGQQGGGVGSGGGGNGGSYFEGPVPPIVPLTLPTVGAPNSGSGGGGGTYNLPSNTNQGAAGGSGIVIIRIKTASIN